MSASARRGEGREEGSRPTASGREAATRGVDGGASAIKKPVKPARVESTNERGGNAEKASRKRGPRQRAERRTESRRPWRRGARP